MAAPAKGYTLSQIAAESSEHQLIPTPPVTIQTTSKDDDEAEELEVVFQLFPATTKWEEEMNELREKTARLEEASLSTLSDI